MLVIKQTNFLGFSFPFFQSFIAAHRNKEMFTRPKYRNLVYSLCKYWIYVVKKKNVFILTHTYVYIYVYIYLSEHVEYLEFEEL